MPTPWNFTIDRTAPTITLLYPPNGASIVAQVVDLNFTVIDTFSHNMTCNLTLDGNIIFSGIVQNNTIKNVSSGLLQEDIHYWNVTCMDQASNTNISETWNFSTIAPPNVTLISPLNDSWSNDSLQILYFNVSDNTGIENCSLYINNILNQTKQGSEITNNALNNFTVSFDNGHYNWSIQCYDNSTAHALGVSETWLLHIDLNPPTPFIDTANNSWFNTFTPTIWFHIIDNMADFINYTFLVDGNTNRQGQVANNTASSIQLLSISEGSHEVVLRAIDYASNVNDSAPITIHVDTTPPTITLLAPNNDAKVYSTLVEFNYSFIDNLSPNATCSLTLDGQVIDTRTVNNNTITTISYTTTYGTHYWNVSCTDLAANTGISDTWNFTVVMPDLVITSGNITFNDSQVSEGENITIFANIYNTGDNNASDFSVEFRLASPTGSLVATRNISFLAVNENKTVNASIIAGLGVHNIYVIVDPPLATNGSIQEINESNNLANNSFIVESWHYAYGNASASLYMYDGSYHYSFRWILPNSTGSKIYVTDTDSSIDWTNLQAIGRKTDNTSTSNDFEEIDTALGSTNYPDNVNHTYTINGLPREVEDIDVFGRVIQNVPFVNSTNNTNFKTGILWDMSDGGTEYSGTQDLVFVSIVNESKQGKWGIYDFEIRIPARLRDYKPGTSTVTFYTEIR